MAEHNLTFPILLHPDAITLALRVIGALDPEELDAWLDERLPQSVTKGLTISD